MLDFIVERGLNINPIAERLIEIASQKNNLQMLKYLIDKGASLTTTDYDSIYGHTCLQWAVLNGNLETIKLLIEIGASLGANGSIYQTALKTFNCEIIDYLERKIINKIQ
jgi:ankyrin repeat protein